MMGRRASLWLVGLAMLTLLLAGLGCSVCPFVPQLPSTSTPSPPPANTPVLVNTPTLEPTPTPEVSVEMALYADPVMGLSVLYPAGWAYEAETEGVFFSENEDALGTGMMSDSPFFIALANTPEEIEYEFGAMDTVQDLLDAVLDVLCGVGCEIGESEARIFGDIPGVGVKASWVDTLSEVRIQGYFVAAVSDDVAGVGLGASSEDDWASYEPIFQDMFASLEFFPPELPDPVERGTIQPGEAVRGTLSIGSREIWAFDAQKGQYVTIWLDAVNSDDLDTYLELYDEGDAAIVEDDDGGTDTNSLIFDFRIDASGTYYIHAWPYGGEGDYALSLEIADGPSGGGEIEYGEIAKGTLGGGEHAWEFYGAAGDEVSVAMRVLEGDLDCYLELYSPDEDWLTSDDDSGGSLDALIEYFVLPTEGWYRIVASDLSGESGEYELALELAQLEIEGNLTSDQTATATLDQGTRHHWLFEGKPGDIVNISLTALDKDLDTYLELYAPNGEQVSTDDDSGGGSNAAILEFELLHTGTYRVVARGYNDEQMGEYEITLEMAQLEIQGNLVSGQAVAATLDQGSRHHWLFEGGVGDVVNISVISADGDMDTYLELFAPDGEPIITDDDSGEGANAAILEFELPYAGLYRLVVRGYISEQIGEYELTLEMVELEIKGTLIYDQSVSMMLKSGNRHHWLFEGNAGDVVSVVMMAVNEDMDTYLELYAPNGEQVMTDDDSGGDSNAAVLEFELPLAGTYRVVARGYSSYDTGEYELTLTRP
ncbi:MAG: hypothetical protein GY832_14020 [Chloroflexi bacterium]|nr:hypothetical protein [Chloroflexota bacterium]